MNWLPIHSVKWGQIRQADFLYGSQLSFDKISEQIHWKNDLMPAGKVIHEWSSRVNFQETRENFQLPYLKMSQKYALKLVGWADVNDGLFIRVQFFDHHSHLIQENFLRTDQIMFNTPSNYLFYKVALINAGVKICRFKEIILFEENNLNAPSTLNFSSIWQSDVQNVVQDRSILNAKIMSAAPVTNRLTMGIQASQYAFNVIHILPLNIDQREEMVVKAILNNAKRFQDIEKVNILFEEESGFNLSEVIKMLKHQDVPVAVLSLEDTTIKTNDSNDLMAPIWKRNYQVINLTTNSKRLMM